MIFHDRQVNSMAFQACKMKFLHNLYKPCPKTFWILPEFGKYKRILLLSFPPYTTSESIFLMSSDSTVEQLEKFFAFPTYDCVCFLTMCSVRSRENNDCFVHANSFVCILNCLSVELFFSVISWQCNIAVKITETTEVVWYNRTFAACHSRGTKLPCWDAKVALGQDKQRKLLFQIMYAFCWSCPSATFAF